MLNVIEIAEDIGMEAAGWPKKSGTIPCPLKEAWRTIQALAKMDMIVVESNPDEEPPRIHITSVGKRALDEWHRRYEWLDPEWMEEQLR